MELTVSEEGFVFVKGGCVNCHNKDGAPERAPKK
jgi:mono/diheme cytochrome c family protein